MTVPQTVLQRLLKRFQEKDRRIRVLFQENQYAGIARNNGMKIAQGEYLLFLDADDFFEDTLRKKSTVREKRWEQILYCLEQSSIIGKRAAFRLHHGI